MPTALAFRWEHAGHLVLLELDDEELEFQAGHFLFLNARDFAHAMGGINHMVIGLELRASCWSWRRLS
jgi:hypothetical protein